MSKNDDPFGELSAELSEALRAVLHAARTDADLSLGEVAAGSGLNRQAITFIEQGERRPTTETFARHALSLGLRPSEVWKRAEDSLTARLQRHLPN